MNRKKHIKIVSQRVHSHLIYPNHWFNVANACRILQNCRNQNNLCEGKNGQIIISHYFATAKRHIPNTLARRVPYYGFNIAKRKQKEPNQHWRREERRKNNYHNYRNCWVVKKSRNFACHTNICTVFNSHNHTHDEYKWQKNAPAIQPQNRMQKWNKLLFSSCIHLKDSRYHAQIDVRRYIDGHAHNC